MKLSETKKTIETLENLDPNDNYAYEKALLAYFNLGGLPLFTYEIPIEGMSLFHSRTHNNEDFFYKISEISIPPSKYVKYFARCNRPFQSIFYCSENRPTSYMEYVESWVKSKSIGETLKVTIGEWEFKKAIKAIIVTTPNPDERVSVFDKEHGAELDKFLKNYKDDELKAQKLFYSFLFEKFRKSAKDDLKTYLITSAYCNLAIAHENSEAEAVFYPSVPFGGNGVNLAITEDYINSDNLELKSVMRNKLLITENESKSKTFTEIDRKDAKEIKNNEDIIIWDE